MINETETNEKEEKNIVLDSFEKAYNSYKSVKEPYEKQIIEEFNIEEEEEEVQQNFENTNFSFSVQSSEEFNKDLMIEEEEEEEKEPETKKQKISSDKEERKEIEQKSDNLFTNDSNAQIPPFPSEIIENEELKNLLLGWYYAGYYTGLYQASKKK